MTAAMFSAEHAWARLDGEEAVIGVSAFAQESLGPLVYVDLPDVGARIERDTACGILESAKTASDVIAPVSGHIIAVNEAVLNDPELVNRAPLLEGWLVRIRPDSGTEGLMDADGYAAFIASL